MLRIVIGALSLMLIYVCSENGEWGSVAVVAVVALLLIWIIGQAHEDARAYVNRRDFWARGGPDRK